MPSSGNEGSRKSADEAEQSVEIEQQEAKSGFSPKYHPNYVRNLISESTVEILKKLESELLSLKRFVRNVEKPSKVKLSDENAFKLEGTTFEEAVNVVKDILLKIGSKLDEYTKDLETRDEQLDLQTSNPALDLYYTEYVNEIAIYIMKIVEESFSTFSERLMQKSDLKYVAKAPDLRPIPPGKFRHGKPAQLFNSDGTVYAHYDKKMKRKKENYDIGWEEPEGVSEGCKYCHNSNTPLFGRHNTLKSVPESFDLLLDATGSLLNFCRTLIVQAFPVEEKAHVYRRFKRQHAVRKNEVEIPITGECCEECCAQCCDLCKRKHKVDFFKKDGNPKVRTSSPFDCQPCWMKEESSSNNSDSANLSESTSNSDSPNNSDYVSNHRKLKRKTSTTESGIQTRRRENFHRCIEVPHRNIFNFSKSYDSVISGQMEGNESSEPQKVPPRRGKPFVTHSSPTNEMISREHCEIHKGKIKLDMKKDMHKQKRSKVTFSNLHRKSKDDGQEKYLTQSPELKTELSKSEKEQNLSDVEEETDEDEKCPGNVFSFFLRGEDTEDEVRVHFKVPERIIFNLKEFSQLLKQKLTEESCLSSESILLDCLQRNFAFSFDEDEENADSFEYKDADSEAFGKEYEKSLDAKVEDLVSRTFNYTSGLLEQETEGPSEENNVERESYEDNAVKDKTVKDKAVRPKEIRLKQACWRCADKNKADIAPKNGSMFSGLVNPSDKKSCMVCWNLRQKSEKIHQCHNSLPDDLLEIRHMSKRGKVRACFVKWDKSKEPCDWRWIKSPFHDPTRIEQFENESNDTELVFKIIFGPETKSIKKSYAESKLNVVDIMPKVTYSPVPTPSEQKFRRKSLSWVDMCRQEIFEKLNVGEKRIQTDRTILIKISRFFDDIHLNGYGAGPPLVLKLRQGKLMEDAFEVLMVPSNIPINYYQSLRAVFITEDGKLPKGSGLPATSTENFLDLDESDELFQTFSSHLFSPGNYSLFEYPTDRSKSLHMNPHAACHDKWFEFAGVVLALSFLHQKQMSCNLSKSFLKCLLDRPLNVQDLEETDTILYQKLMYIKSNDVTDKSNLNFVVRERHYDQDFVEKELVKDGQNIPLTEENKFDYIELATKWILAERCLPQLKAFRKGFESVLEPSLLTIFSVKELQMLIRYPPENISDIPVLTSVSRRETW